MRFATPRVDCERHPDGTTILRSSHPLGPCDRAVGDWLLRWAARAPERTFLVERNGDDRRVAEAFKLSSGTWVHAGAVRVAIVAACDPLVQDAVITGHDRDEIGALLFVNRIVIADLGLDTAALHARLRRALNDLRSTATGSSPAPARLLILDEPPSIDGNEITDKGYINQRATLTRRAAHVNELYAGGSGVLT